MHDGLGRSRSQQQQQQRTAPLTWMLTQHVTASKLLSAAAQPSGSVLRLRTKKLSRRGLRASSAALMPCPTTRSYETSGGRCDTQLLHRSSTVPPGGMRLRYSSVTWRKKASSTCVTRRGEAA